MRRAAPMMPSFPRGEGGPKFKRSWLRKVKAMLCFLPQLGQANMAAVTSTNLATESLQHPLSATSSAAKRAPCEDPIAPAAAAVASAADATVTLATQTTRAPATEASEQLQLLPMHAPQCPAMDAAPAGPAAPPRAVVNLTLNAVKELQVEAESVALVPSQEIACRPQAAEDVNNKAQTAEAGLAGQQPQTPATRLLPTLPSWKSVAGTVHPLAHVPPTLHRLQPSPEDTEDSTASVPVVPADAEYSEPFVYTPQRNTPNKRAHSSSTLTRVSTRPHSGALSTSAPALPNSLQALGNLRLVYKTVPGPVIPTGAPQGRKLTRCSTTTSALPQLRFSFSKAVSGPAALSPRPGTHGLKSFSSRALVVGGLNEAYSRGVSSTSSRLSLNVFRGTIRPQHGNCRLPEPAPLLSGLETIAAAVQLCTGGSGTLLGEARGYVRQRKAPHAQQQQQQLEAHREDAKAALVRLQDWARGL